MLRFGILLDEERESREWYCFDLDPKYLLAFARGKDECFS